MAIFKETKRPRLRVVRPPSMHDGEVEYDQATRRLTVRCRRCRTTWLSWLLYFEESGEPCRDGQGAEEREGGQR